MIRIKKNIIMALILLSVSYVRAEDALQTRVSFNGVNVTSLALSNPSQFEDAYKVIQKQLGQVRVRSHLHTQLVVVDAANLSAQGVEHVEQISQDLAVPAEAMALPKRPGYLKALITMTLVTTAATGGATTAALLYGETVSPSTAVAMGVLWGGVSGGYIFNNERMQNWIRKTSSFEHKLNKALNIKSPTLLSHLKATGEWSKYFLHIAGWNAFGALAVSALEGSWQTTATAVLTTSLAELVAGAPLDLAMASDTERLKKKYPVHAQKIQLMSGFGQMVVEIAAQVLSVIALTGATYEAGVGFAAMSLGGSIYYAKTFIQDYRERKRQSEPDKLKTCDELIQKFKSNPLLSGFMPPQKSYNFTHSPKFAITQ